MRFRDRTNPLSVSVSCNLILLRHVSIVVFTIFKWWEAQNKQGRRLAALLLLRLVPRLDESKASLRCLNLRRVIYSKKSQQGHRSRAGVIKYCEPKGLAY